MKTLTEDFGFTNYSQAPTQSQAGRIVVLWNAATFKVDEIAVTNQEVHCMVQILAAPAP